MLRDALRASVAAGLLALATVLAGTAFSAAPVGAAAASSAAAPVTAAAQAGGPEVSAWTFGSRASLRTAAGAGAIDEVQPDWYTVRRDGSLIARGLDLTFVKLAHGRGCRVLATVSNYSGGDFSPRVAHAVLASGAARERLIDALVTACGTFGYDGVDLDFESVPAVDRELLSSFVEELAAALHANGCLLGIAVHPKTGEPGGWSGARAEDYARLGAAVDEFQVMTYAFSGPWSDPGPIAPPRWADRVLDFAVTQVDPAKVWMGIPFYGCDWWPGGAEEISWRQATRRLRSHHGHRTRATSGEARYSYRDGRGRHTVFFQDRLALAAKLDVLTRGHPDLAGIAIWVMGGEDPRFWPQIQRRLSL